MAIVTTDDRHYKNIANKIREKIVDQNGIKPENMAEQIEQACENEYDNGWAEGYKTGYDYAWDEWYDDGFDDGYQVGYNEQNNYMKSIVDRTVTEVTAESLDGMTEVGGYSFYGCNNLKSVELPEGITSIKGAAFQNCTALESVTLPKTLAYITASAFNGCSALTDLTIPENVKDAAGYSLRIGATTNKATITFLGKPPTISSTTFEVSKIEKIRVKRIYLDEFENNTNWTYVTDAVPLEVLEDETA